MWNSIFKGGGDDDDEGEAAEEAVAEAQSFDTAETPDATPQNLLGNFSYVSKIANKFAETFDDDDGDDVGGFGDDESGGGWNEDDDIDLSSSQKTEDAEPASKEAADNAEGPSGSPQEAAALADVPADNGDATASPPAGEQEEAPAVPLAAEEKETPAPVESPLEQGEEPDGDGRPLDAVTIPTESGSADGASTPPRLTATDGHGTNVTPPPSSGSMPLSPNDSVGIRLVHSGLAVAETLDNVISEINQQEENVNIEVISQVDSFDDSAIEEMQQELQEVDKAVVDHTPSDDVIETQKRDGKEETIGSVGVLVASVGSGEDNGVDFGPVVDHLPQTPAGAMTNDNTSSSPSLAVAANDIEEDFREDEAMDYTCFDEDDEYEERPRTTNFSPKLTIIENNVVDHTPQDHDEESVKFRNPSIVACAEDNDGDDENENEYGPVVDQTPETPIADATGSLAVQPEFQDDDDDDEYASDSSSSKVVDHTPSEILELPKKRFGASVDVISASRDGTRDDESATAKIDYGPVVDHTPTVDSSLVINRSDSIVVQNNNAEMSDDDDDSVTGAADDESEEEIVDYLPPRPASRFGDASTLVAADPSEVLSVNDGLAEEQSGFGPVVDQTPLEHDIATSGAVSTGVVANSLATDDLDEDDEEEEEEDDGITEQEWGVVMPLDNSNPQDNEVPAIAEPQLVDFLPPENERENVADTDRHSEVTVGEAQSLIPGAEDLNFGPVVDQIPADDNSSQIESTIGDSSPIKNSQMVDHFPSGKRTVESDGTIGKSQLSEEEEDMSKFGPVVDQLPLSEIATGGSTVDALAADTVRSENWDDDFDMSIVSESTGKAGIRKSTGSVVRFDVQQEESESQFYDPENRWDLMDDSSNRFHDTKSFAEADTPPSTPHRKPTSPINELPKSGIQLPDLPQSLVQVQLDGQNVKIDTNLLLQNPGLRRQLLASMEIFEEKKESGDVGQRIASMQNELASKATECNLLSEKLSELEGRLRQSELSALQQAPVPPEFSERLKDTISQLKLQLEDSDELVKTTETARLELERKIKALELEVANLRSSSKAVKDLQEQHEKDLVQQYELLDRKSANIKSLEEMLSKLESEKTQIMTDLLEQRTLADQSELLANELVAVAKERDMLEESLTMSRETMQELQRIITEHGERRKEQDEERAAETESLKAELDDVKKALVDKGIELQGLGDEIASLTKERELMASSLQDAQDSRAKALSALDEALAQSSKFEETAERAVGELSEVKEDLGNVTADRDKLQAEVKEATLQMETFGESLRQVEQDCENYSKKSALLEQEISEVRANEQLVLSQKGELEASMKQLESEKLAQLQNFEASNLELKAQYEKDLEALKSGNNELLEDVARLQNREAEHSAELLELRKASEQDCELHKEARTKLEAECEELRIEISRLIELESEHAKDLARLQLATSDEADRLKQEVEKYRTLQNSAADEIEERLKEKQAEHKADVATLELEIESLQTRIADYEQLEDEHKATVRSIGQDSSAREESLETSLKSAQEELRRVQAALSDSLLQESAFAEERKKLEDTMMSQSDTFHKESEEMLVQFGILKQQADLSDQLIASLKSEISDLSSKVHVVSDERDECRSKLKSAEAGLLGLQSERSEQEANLQALQLQLTELDLLCKSQQAKLSALEQQNEGDVAAVVAEKDADLRRMENELTSLQAAIKETTATSRVLQERIQEQDESSSRKLNELTTQNKELESNLTMTKEKLEAAEASVEAKRQVSELLKDSEEQVVNLESQLADKDQAVSSLDQELRALRAEFENVAVAAEETAKRQTEEVHALQSQVEGLGQSLEKTRDRLVNRERQVDELGLEIQNMKSQHAATQVSELIQAIEKRSMPKSRARLVRSASAREAELKHLQAQRQEHEETRRQLEETVRNFCL